MAYRAASQHPANAVIVLGGDVPPDVAAASVVLPPVLIGRGVRDQWYTDAKMTADLAALHGSGTAVETCVFDGGHEWTTAFRDAAAVVLRRAYSE
jgi:predicted esterase